MSLHYRFSSILFSTTFTVLVELYIYASEFDVHHLEYGVQLLPVLVYQRTEALSFLEITTQTLVSHYILTE